MTDRDEHERDAAVTVETAESEAVIALARASIDRWRVALDILASQ